jgi:uncharacterized protein YbaR (Trm112 family)
MQVELFCPHCSQHFLAPAQTAAARAFEQMSDEGPWSALGDGETFEDRIFAALTAQGTIHCPKCTAAVPIREETVVELAQALLANW